MSNTRKVKAPPIFDVDAFIAETTVASQQVSLRFRGKEWVFKGITEAPLKLFDDSLETAQSSLFFLQTMLVEGQDFPEDMSLREATALVQAYTTEAVKLTPGE